MFTRCIACNADLGANETLEAFPVGRRLAFDAAKGRLWVVCPACKQWNLSPLEERWEAIEAAERLYRDTKKRVTTDEVGLARAGDGIDLVRIGAPQRPEFAAWRYGERFVRRRTKHLALVAGGIAAGGAVIAGGFAAGVLAASSVNFIQWGVRGAVNGYRRLRIATRFEDEFGHRHLVSYAHMRRAGIVRDPDSDWQLVLPTLRQHEGLGARLFGSLDAGPPVVLRDAAALKLMSRLLPHVNAAGAKPADVQGAVSQLERGADLSRLAVMAANTAVPKRIVGKKGKVSHAGLPEVPLQVRLALEMALHEDDERRWLEGELDELTDRWREAEEVAAIADTLLVPGWIEARLGRGDERAP